MCDKKNETISHIVTKCEKLAQKEYKRRHDNVARIVHWKLCGKYNLKRSEKWYEHAPEGVVENEEVKILWDVMIQCDREIKARKPNIENPINIPHQFIYRRQEILVKKAEMESYNEEEKELLMRVVKEIRYDPERIPPNLRQTDRNKVRAATVKINKIVSPIKTETITETNSVLCAAGNIVPEILGYKNKEMTGKTQTNWQKRILQKQKLLHKELGQINRMRWRELQN